MNPAMTTALIIGITGQDGSYLAEELRAKGYRTIGAVRDPSAPGDARRRRAAESASELVHWDMLDPTVIKRILLTYRPREVYNFAAYSSGEGMYDDPVGMGQVNGMAVVRVLEAIREVDPEIRFCQASSREVFGEASESPQRETTPANPRSPYGAAKLYADSMIRIYRQRFGLFACSAILFNHESPRRGAQFVTRKITRGAAQIKLGLADALSLGNLDVYRDWGFAKDYVHAMWLMLQQAEADDFVLATGEVHSVREFCDVAFRHLGLDYRNYVREDPQAFRPAEPLTLVGDIDKARSRLDWSPSTSFEELVHMMVDADMADLSTHTL